MSEDELNILKTDVTFDLSTNKSDIIALLVKGALGSAPVVGNLLAETLTQFIPNQKQDRVVECLEIFSDKVRFLEDDFLEQKIRSAEFADLLEEVITKASRAVTPERREYLASLLKNSMTRDELDHLGHKKLLRLLDELDDAEIIIMKYHYIADEFERDRFQVLHNSVITGFNPIPENATQKERDNYIIFEERHKALTRLGLNEADPERKKIGALLLRFIDLF